MSYLAFAGALRKGSWNRKLLGASLAVARAKQIQTELLDLNDYTLPPLNADISLSDPMAKPAQNLAEKIRKSNGIILSSAEYNNSMPGFLKNLFDWVSMFRPVPWTKKPVLFLSSSPSLVGGNRGLWALRVPFEACGAYVYPDMFSLSQASDGSFDGEKLKEASLQTRLEKLVVSFDEWAKKIG